MLNEYMPYQHVQHKKNVCRVYGNLACILQVGMYQPKGVKFGSLLLVNETTAAGRS